jgi:cobalt-precorrin 5A hydrolase
LEVGAMTASDRCGLAVVCLTPQAFPAARHLSRALGARLHAHHLVTDSDGARTFLRLATCLEDLWTRVEGIVVFAPTGAVVRSLAPLLDHKTRDPGVVVVDAMARWAIPLVGGHEGGANRLAERVANLLGSEPVVTTASEAVRDLVVGVGCRRGASSEAILEAVDQALACRNLSWDRVRSLATGSPKRREAGLLEAAASRGVPLIVVHHLELRSRRRGVHRTAASRRIGLPALSQPAALAAGRRTKCLLNRFRHGPVMLSIAQECCGWWDSDPEPPAIALRRP